MYDRGAYHREEPDPTYALTEDEFRATLDPAHDDSGINEFLLDDWRAAQRRSRPVDPDSLFAAQPHSGTHSVIGMVNGGPGRTVPRHRPGGHSAPGRSRSHWKRLPGLLAPVGLLITESLARRRTTIALALFRNPFRILSFIAGIPSRVRQISPARFRTGQSILLVPQSAYPMGQQPFINVGPPCPADAGWQPDHPAHRA
ncbi:hypothetical protein GA0074696_1481 [Micromonospora purpureochromogenes]|uniref:Uncharacterized protein n=1 Tax=Micromonospora purpureochromogenes TaxID=47872 RepID=A0A1C4VYF7_9ACTN|nr:hypothetical protein [Micromonospora purpureochromogenes]SCE88990.1 hypothetical protein GA0074696_1481 [Micromonospora purpureochromogenes]